MIQLRFDLIFTQTITFVRYFDTVDYVKPRFQARNVHLLFLEGLRLIKELCD